MHRVLERQLRKIGIGQDGPTTEQWRALLERVDRAYTEADQDRYTLERALDLSSTEMRKRFQALRDAQGQLLAASRKAGMADVATNVLHNVGNVLNSVNVSASVITDIARSPVRGGLRKGLALLRGQPQPGRFLDEDPRGRKLLDYLAAVDQALGDERERIARELEALTKHVDHIRAIVTQQLSATKRDKHAARLTEQVDLPDLLDDGISVLRSSFGSPERITFVRDYESLDLATDRHKVFQILINLLTNARDAVSNLADARITVRCRRLPEDQIAIEVEDNGVGIPADALHRAFAHGFTTKPTGHGFGLHYAACAAIELGGTLTASSDGAGQGARLTLVLPRRPAIAEAA